MSNIPEIVPLNERKSQKLSDYSQLSNAGSSDEENENATEEDYSKSINQSNKDEKSSSFSIMMVILRTFVGTGILAMPYTFKNLGLYLGLAGTLIVWILMTYSLYILVLAASDAEKYSKKKELGYGEVLEEALLMGPLWLRGFAKRGRTVMNGIIVSLQFGCCCVYIVFIADNIKEVINEEFNKSWSNQIYILMLSPVFILLGLVRNLDLLSKFSAFGNVVFVVGFIIIMQYVAHNFLPLDELPKIVSAWNWPRGISSAVFAFEGICLVLPLRNKMRHPDEYMGCNGVLMTSMYLILILYEALGFYGYLRFGTSVHATISLDLPHEPLYIALKIIFPMVIMCSFAAQFFVIVEIVYTNWLGTKDASILWELLFRVLCVLLCIVFALAIPMLGSLIQLVGALLGITISITVPNIIVLLVSFPEGKYGILKWRIPFHLILSLLGLLVTILGTFTTILDIIDAYKHPQEIQYSEIVSSSSAPTTL